MKVGVIGLGYWGSKVFDEYVNLRDQDQIHELAACDIDSERLAAVAETADDTYTSVSELQDEVDALHVCTGNKSHYEIADEALGRGTDVLLEKPLTVDSDRAYDLVERASETGQILQTGHIYRFANVIREVKELYQEGYFGEVYSVTLRWTHRIEPREDGVVWDLLPHPIDILNFITGAWPEEVRGFTDSYRISDRSEIAKIQFQVDGVPADIHLSWVDPVRRRDLEIVGSDRSALVECVDQRIDIQSNEDSTEGIEINKNNTLLAEAENFVRATETRENKFNSAIVGARTVDTIETIQEAIE